MLKLAQPFSQIQGLERSKTQADPQTSRLALQQKLLCSELLSHIRAQIVTHITLRISEVPESQAIVGIWDQNIGNS